MKTELFLKLEQAIDGVIQDNCEEGYWDGYIHESLSQQMAKAAALVFDSSMDSQEYVTGERGER